MTIHRNVFARTRNALVGALAPVLVLVGAPAGHSQMMANPSYTQDQDTIARDKYAAITAENLDRSHAAISWALRHAKGKEDDDGTFQPPALVSWFNDHEYLDGFSDPGEPNNGVEASGPEERTWGLHHRLCQSSPGSAQWYLLTWVDPPSGYKFGWTATDIQARAEKYFEELEKRFDPETSGAGLLKVTTTGSGWTFDGWDSGSEEIPSCMMPPKADDHADWEGIAAGTYIAQFSSIDILDGSTRTFRENAYRWASCPPPSEPSLTIGYARMRQETDLVTTLDGKQVSKTTKPWTYDSGCAAPKTQWRQIASVCKYKFPVGNSMAEGAVMWKQLYEQVPNPADQGQTDIPTKSMDFAHVSSWQPVLSEPPQEISSTCPGSAPATPFDSVHSSSSTQTRALSCSSVHPGFPNGAFDQSRVVTTTVETLPAGSTPSQVTSTNYSAWQTTTDSCYRTYGTSQSQTLGCPAGEVGSVSQTRNGTVTAYAMGAASTAWGGWYTTQNTCAPPTPYCASVVATNFGSDNYSYYYVHMSDGSSVYTRTPADYGCTWAQILGDSTNSSGTSGSSGGGADHVTSSGSIAPGEAEPGDPANGGSGAQSVSGSTNGGSTGGNEGSFIGSALARRREEDLEESDMLQTLRRWRNGWVRRLPGGWDLVQEYYRLGWTLILTIPPEHSDWDWIAEQVDHIVAAIRSDDNYGALDAYVAMVRRLQSTWLNAGARA